MYKIYFHYMHFSPSQIVKMEIPESLLVRTLDLLKLDKNIIVGDVEKVK